jgi:hypothetical protein
LNEIAHSRSNGAGMKTRFICAFVLALLAMSILVGRSDNTNSLVLISPGVTNLFSTNAQAALKPQVYQASPYSCIVLVPQPIDTAAVISPPSTNRYAIRTIEPQPPLHLLPVK